MGRKPIRSSAQKSKESADADDPGGSQTSQIVSSQSSSGARDEVKVAEGNAAAESEALPGKSLEENTGASPETVETHPADVVMSSPKSESSIIAERMMELESEEIREKRLRGPVDLNHGDPPEQNVETNVPPGKGTMIEGYGFPAPNIANMIGPVENVPEYVGERGRRTELPSRKMNLNTCQKLETVKSDMTGSWDIFSIMSEKVPGLAADDRNKHIANEADKWMFPATWNAVNNKVMYPNIVTGKLTEKMVTNSADGTSYKLTFQEDCDQPFMVRPQKFITEESAKALYGEKSVVRLPSGLVGVRLSDEEPRVIPPCPPGMLSFLLGERREALPIHAAPLVESLVAADPSTNAEMVHWPQNEGLTFHHPRCVKVEDKQDAVLYPPHNRNVRENPVFWEKTDILQDGKFLWSVGSEHSKCESLPRPIWFGLDLWAGGVIDIDHKQTLHSLPGFVVLTDEQVQAKRPFACITMGQCQWIDMIERVLMRQHEIRGGDHRYENAHGPGELGPVSIYSLDQVIRPETWQNMCHEARRWCNVAVPKADLINMVNSAVYAVTCAAKGRELCRARNELKKANKELQECYEEMFGQAEAALDARFRVACECFRRARTVCLQTTAQDDRLAENQARLYVPDMKLSRALVQLSRIDTLTMGRAEMQLYEGKNKRLATDEEYRYECGLLRNPSAIMGYPMPANDLAYMWGMLSGILQASLVHLDVVMMAGLKPSMKTAMKPSDCAEWNPNQAAYLMGLARDEFEQTVRTKVGPRVVTLTDSEQCVEEKWTPPVYIDPTVEYAERALLVPHPTCVAWRYELPDKWDGTAVHSRLVGRVDPFDGDHKLLPSNPRAREEKLALAEDYVDMLAAVNVESKRREIWDPEIEQHWVARADKIDDDQRPSILLGEAWVRQKNKLTQKFEEKMIRKVNQYLAKPARSVTRALRHDVSQTIGNAAAWLDPSLTDEERMAMSAPMGGRTAETGEPRDEPMDDAPLVPKESYTEYGGEPLPPSTASSTRGSGRKRKRKPKKGPNAPPPQKAAIDPNARRSPARTGSEDESVTGEESADSAVEDLDPDYYAVCAGLRRSEVNSLPKSKQLEALPEHTLWNVLQARPTRKAWNAEINMKDTANRLIKVDKMSEFCLDHLVTSEPPIRTKAKVKAIVEQQHAQRGEGWETPAIVQMTENGRYEHLARDHRLMEIAQWICDRDAKLALGHASEVTMTPPPAVHFLPPSQQPRTKQMELLRRHNAEVEAIRGVTAWKYAPPRASLFDYLSRKVPLDRDYLFDEYMLLSDDEYREWETAHTNQWSAIRELRSMEQLCYVPLEGRSYNLRASEELHKAVKYLLQCTKIVQQGRRRLYDATTNAKTLTKDWSLESAEKELAETNETCKLVGSPEKALIQFAMTEDWNNFGDLAPVAAVGECEKHLNMVNLPAQMVRAGELRDPTMLVSDRDGTALAGIMLLLGVPVYKMPKTVMESRLHWYSCGFIFRALGEKQEGEKRKAECVNVFRGKPMRLCFALNERNESWANSNMLNIEELWLEDKQYRRVTNRVDDEYRPSEMYGNVTEDGGPNIQYYPANVLRKILGRPYNPDLVGEYWKAKDTDEFYCKCCNVQFRDGCRDKEYCMFRRENHPFGTIMLKLWCNPTVERTLPEDEERLRQKRKLIAERVRQAAEIYLSPDNRGSLKDIALWTGVSEQLLSTEVEKIRRLNSQELGELPLEEVRPLDLEKAMKSKPEPDPCGRCGGRYHTTAECKAGQAQKLTHYQAVMSELTKPAPRLPLSASETPASAAAASGGVDWRKGALAKMREGKMTVEEVQPTSSNLSQLVTAPPRDDRTSGGRRDPERRYKRERDSSTESSSFSRSSRGGRGRYSRGGVTWASSYRDEPQAKRVSNPSRSRSSGRGDTPGFSKSFAGQSSSEFKAPRDPPAWRQHPEKQSYCAEVDDNYTRAYHSNPGQIGRGYEYVTDKRYGGEPRYRHRYVALAKNRLGDFHDFKEVNAELSRAAYENSGFMPATLRDCAQRGKLVPDEAKYTDRRVACEAMPLERVGHDEVYKKWSKAERRCHENFYKRDYLPLKNEGWCLKCLCPGHFQSRCRLDAPDGRLECMHCGSGIHNHTACPLVEQSVGCDQCGSMNHGRLRCGLNAELVGDATCSVRHRLLRAYARFLPHFYESEEEHKAALASRPELLYMGRAERVSELVRVLRVLGVDEGYY